MIYYKSRGSIRKAALARLAETTQVLELTRQALDPILLCYDISTPEGVVDKLLAAHEKGELLVHDKGELTDHDLVGIIETLTKYERAKAAQVQFRIVSEHVADFHGGEKKFLLENVPLDWIYVKLDEEQLRYFYCAYEAIKGSPNARHRPGDPAAAARAILLETRGSHIGRLQHLLIGKAAQSDVAAPRG